MATAAFYGELSSRLSMISLGAYELHLRVVLLLSPFYSPGKGDTRRAAVMTHTGQEGFVQFLSFYS